MKKIILAVCIAFAGALTASAQKFALIDMEYVLRNIPAYEMANEQLNQVSQRWEKEVNDMAKEAETLYRNYETDMVFPMTPVGKAVDFIMLDKDTVYDPNN